MHICRGISIAPRGNIEEYFYAKHLIVLPKSSKNGSKMTTASQNESTRPRVASKMMVTSMALQSIRRVNF